MREACGEVSGRDSIPSPLELGETDARRQPATLGITGAKLNALVRQSQEQSVGRDGLRQPVREFAPDRCGGCAELADSSRPSRRHEAGNRGSQSYCGLGQQLSGSKAFQLGRERSIDFFRFLNVRLHKQTR
ncbi:hypothetical protein L1887_60639 [Cichorium endivia]|nr:hypothetical protein L1887_60639 [Cichorium endivia]